MDEFLGELLERKTYQAALAELIGTGLLTFAALLAGTPYAVALILAALVYALGPISGAQLNPAVTLGLLAARRISAMKAVLYLDAQILGALLAATLAPALRRVAGDYQPGLPVGEFVGAGLLVFTVVAVVAKQVSEQAGGIAIGAALGAGLLLSGGVLNPAIAIAMGLGRSPALWASALGGAAFAVLYRLLSTAPEEQADAEEAGEQEDEGEKWEQEAHATPAAAPHPIVVRQRPAAPAFPRRPRTRVRPSRLAPAASGGFVTGLVGVVQRLLRRDRQGKPAPGRTPLAQPESGD